MKLACRDGRLELRGEDRSVETVQRLGTLPMVGERIGIQERLGMVVDETIHVGRVLGDRTDTGDTGACDAFQELDRPVDVVGGSEGRGGLQVENRPRPVPFGPQPCQPVSADIVSGCGIRGELGRPAERDLGPPRPRDLGFGGGGVAGLPSIDTNVFGFAQLATLYSTTFVDEAQRAGKTVGQVLRFYDACSLVPDKRGSANLIIVEWAHGAETRTSYEEIQELLNKNYEDSIRPWQYWLFFIGFSMNIVMFVLTYVLRERGPSTAVSNKTAGGDA